MKAHVLTDTTATGLEEKINKIITSPEVSTVYPIQGIATTTIPQMRGDKVTGYKTEYTTIIYTENVGKGGGSSCDN